MNTLNRVLTTNPETADLQRFSESSPKGPQDAEAIKKLSDEFEAIFMEIVLKSMRETVDKSQLTDGGNGEQIFQSMLDSEYSKNLASQRTSGLADSIEKHLLGLVPGSDKAASINKAVGRIQYQKAATEVSGR